MDTWFAKLTDRRLNTDEHGDTVKDYVREVVSRWKLYECITETVLEDGRGRYVYAILSGKLIGELPIRNYCVPIGSRIYLKFLASDEAPEEDQDTITQQVFNLEWMSEKDYNDYSGDLPWYFLGWTQDCRVKHVRLCPLPGYLLEVRLEGEDFECNLFSFGYIDGITAWGKSPPIALKDIPVAPNEVIPKHSRIKGIYQNARSLLIPYLATPPESFVEENPNWWREEPFLSDVREVILDIDYAAFACGIVTRIL